MSDRKTADVNRSQDVDPSGLGIGFGLAISGTLLLLFPVLVPVDAGWQTAILVAAVIVSVIGIGGIFLELAKHRSRPWLRDIGTACVVLGLASAFLIVQVRTETWYAVDVILAIIMFALLIIGVVGLGIGLAKAAQSAPSVVTAGGNSKQQVAAPERLRRNDKFSIGVAIGCTVVQCVVSIMIAVLTAKPS